MRSILIKGCCTEKGAKHNYFHTNKKGVNIMVSIIIRRRVLGIVLSLIMRVLAL